MRIENKSHVIEYEDVQIEVEYEDLNQLLLLMRIYRRILSGGEC